MSSFIIKILNEGNKIGGK